MLFIPLSLSLSSCIPSAWLDGNVALWCKGGEIEVLGVLLERLKKLEMKLDVDGR